MLPAIHARRPRQTHRAGRLSEEHASADVTRADGGRNGESNRRTTQSSNRDRHSARPRSIKCALVIRAQIQSPSDITSSIGGEANFEPASNQLVGSWRLLPNRGVRFAIFK